MKTKAEKIRAHCRRAKRWLGIAAAGKRGESMQAWLLPADTPEEKAEYERCQRAADAIIKFVDQREKKGDTELFEMMLYFGYMWHLNTGWEIRRDKVGRHYLDTQHLPRIDKLYESNKEVQKNADAALLKAYNDWKAKHQKKDDSEHDCYLRYVYEYRIDGSRFNRHYDKWKLTEAQRATALEIANQETEGQCRKRYMKAHGDIWVGPKKKARLLSLLGLSRKKKK